MSRFVTRIRGRKAVSSVIGGIIVLTLILTALGTMVFVSQQYDGYQTLVDKKSLIDISRFSENLVADYPGISEPTTTISCGGATACYQYNMTLSNVGGLTNAGSINSGISGGSGGGIGVQIARIYINSTQPQSQAANGCVAPNPQPCLLDSASTPTAYKFRTADRFLNPGEFTHSVLFWLPSSIGLLPNPNPPTPLNTVWIVTTRGRVFSFQWPFPPTGQALEAVNANVATGSMKIAYTGQDYSKNEPAWGGSGSGYCHTETPAAGDQISAGTYGTLYFVNPWITDTFLGDAGFGSPPPTTLYIYAKFTNTKTSPVTVTTGSLLIQVTAASANQKVYFIGGQYIGGIAGSGAFVAAPSALTISASQESTLIFKMLNYQLGSQKNPTGAVALSFSGMAAVSNAATDSTYFGASLLLEGFYDRTSCSTQ